MAAPAFGSAGTALGGSTATTANIPVPASVAVNDIVLAFLYVETTQAVTPSAGFTEAPDSPVVVTGTQAHDLHVFWKRATGADSGTYAFTIAAGLTFRTAGAVRFTGCVTSGNPFDVTASAIKTTTADGTTPAVSDTTTGVDRLWVWIATDFNAGSCSTASGFTEQYDPAAGCTVLDTKEQLTAGSSGSVTATFTNNGASAAWLGALIPSNPSAAPARTVNKQLTVAVRRAGFY